MQRPVVLFVGGLDPSAGAGLLADIKTAEQLGCYGITACTAITYQTDTEFVGLNWLSLSEIKEQLTPLFRRFSILHVKIGIIENLQILNEVLDFIYSFDSSIKVVWDPIIKSSTGFEFQNLATANLLQVILKKIYLATPNTDEVLGWTSQKNIDIAAKQLAASCNILVKGGDLNSSSVVDNLYSNDELRCFESSRIINGAKHGSGCVLSSAICCCLSKKLSLKDSIENARSYVRSFLASNEYLLGFHNRELAA